MLLNLTTVSQLISHYNALAVIMNLTKTTFVGEHSPVSNNKIEQVVQNGLRRPQKDPSFTEVKFAEAINMHLKV